MRPSEKRRMGPQGCGEASTDSNRAVPGSSLGSLPGTSSMPAPSFRVSCLLEFLVLGHVGSAASARRGCAALLHGTTLFCTRQAQARFGKWFTMWLKPLVLPKPRARASAIRVLTDVHTWGRVCVATTNIQSDVPLVAGRSCGRETLQQR